jgi:hypothetical protein
MMCLQQMGGIGHDEVMTSIRLIGELIPEFDKPDGVKRSSGQGR